MEPPAACPAPPEGPRPPPRRPSRAPAYSRARPPGGDLGDSRRRRRRRHNLAHLNGPGAAGGRHGLQQGVRDGRLGSRGRPDGPRLHPLPYSRVGENRRKGDWCVCWGMGWCGGRMPARGGAHGPRQVLRESLFGRPSRSPGLWLLAKERNRNRNRRLPGGGVCEPAALGRWWASVGRAWVVSSALQGVRCVASAKVLGRVRGV